MANNDVLKWMNGTALDLYMAYGVEELPDWNAYSEAVDQIINDVLAQGGRQLLLILPHYALNDCEQNHNDTIALEQIKNRYGSHPRVYGFFVEEPNKASETNNENRWHSSTVAAVRQILQPLVTNLRAFETTEDTYRSYAEATDWLCGFEYPLDKDTDEWQNIESMQRNDSPLVKLRRSTNHDFWFCAQAYTGVPTNFDRKRQPLVHGADSSGESFELTWMTYRALVEGAKGILFYHFNRSDDRLHAAVRRMCTRIHTTGLNRALATPFKVNLSKCVEGDNVFWTYRFHNNSYWLLVVDANPETPGTREFVFEYDVESNLSSAHELRNMNNGSVHPSQHIGGSKHRFSDTMHRGGYGLYRVSP